MFGQLEISKDLFESFLTERGLQCYGKIDEVEKIIGPDIILHHTKLFEKPPKIGAAFHLHKDWSYFPTRNNSMIAAVIHLSKSDEDMGCIKIVPKSHKLGKIKNSDGHRYNSKIHNKYKSDWN